MAIPLQYIARNVWARRLTTALTAGGLALVVFVFATMLMLDAGLKQTLVTTGEHEATRWGFRMLLEMGCCDIIQPDVGWCGGVTELVKIANLADAHGVLMVPHGSSVYSYHFVITRHNSPFAEFLMMAPKADQVVPMFAPQLLGEPVPRDGRIKASALDKPGFGVTLNPEVKMHRPYPR